MWKAIVSLTKSLPTLNITQNYSQQLKRSLIQVVGPDAAPFLQGLMTNDIHHLSEESNKSIYCMFLNVQGRILHDALIYRLNSSFLIETAEESGRSLLVHLNHYKIRRQVSLNLLDPSVWKVFHFSQDPPSASILISRDPRAKDLGWRCIINSQIQSTCGIEIDSYKELRYRLGVSEGPEDLKISSSFPLECNCDYLHGVSFHKGCYIGQELTARTHHTGVVRKRLMPIKFDSPPLDSVEVDAPILNEKGVTVGKVRSVMKESCYGLGLLRVQQALSANTLNVGYKKVSTQRPAWWPIEAPKEIV